MSVPALDLFGHRMHLPSLWLATTGVSALAFLLVAPASGPEPSRAQIALVADLLAADQWCPALKVNYEAMNRAGGLALDPFQERTRTLVERRMRRLELIIQKRGAAACNDLYATYGARGLITRTRDGTRR